MKGAMTMLISNKEILKKLEDQGYFSSRENKDLKERIRYLQLRHERLLKHLGLVEHKVAAHVELRSIAEEQPIKPPEPSQDKQASVESFANREEKTNEFKFLRS
jgi:hypothetical protein